MFVRLGLAEPGDKIGLEWVLKRALGDSLSRNKPKSSWGTCVNSNLRHSPNFPVKCISTTPISRLSHHNTIPITLLTVHFGISALEPNGEQCNHVDL